MLRGLVQGRAGDTDHAEASRGCAVVAAGRRTTSARHHCDASPPRRRRALHGARRDRGIQPCSSPRPAAPGAPPSRMPRIARPRPRACEHHLHAAEWRPVPRNLLKFLLNGLSRPAIPETEICRNGDCSPVRNGAFCSVSQHSEPDNRDGPPACACHVTHRNAPGKVHVPSGPPSNHPRGVAGPFLQCGAPIRTDFATAQALRRETPRISVVERSLFSWLGAGRPILRSRCC
jgi:hypothetical protein